MRKEILLSIAELIILINDYIVEHSFQEQKKVCDNVWLP